MEIKLFDNGPEFIYVKSSILLYFILKITLSVDHILIPMEPHLIFINLVLKKFKYWYGGINFFNKKFCLNFENYEDNLKFNLILIKWISFSFRDPRFPSFFQKIFYSTWFYFVLKNKLSTYLNLKYCRKKKTISNLFKTVPNQKKKKFLMNKILIFLKIFFFCILNLKILTLGPF